MFYGDGAVGGGGGLLKCQCEPRRCLATGHHIGFSGGFDSQGWTSDVIQLSHLTSILHHVQHLISSSLSLTVPLWRAAQKARAAFIRRTLCLRSLRGGVIHGRLSSALFAVNQQPESGSLFVSWCGGGGEGYVHKPTDERFITNRDQPGAHWIMHHLTTVEKKYAEYASAEQKVREEVRKHVKLVLNLTSVGTRQQRDCVAHVTWQMSSGLVQGGFPLSYNELCRGNLHPRGL